MLLNVCVNYEYDQMINDVNKWKS